MKKSKIVLSGDRLMNGLTIIVNVLFILAVILLGVNIDFSVNSKNAIKNGLTDMAENLKIQTGAKSIDVNVYSGDNYFEINPSDSAYHAYLTINVDNVKQKTENEWLAVLMNGEKYAYKDYGYGNDDYALYTRTLTVPYLIREVPVFVTITDGYKSYCLYNNYSYDSEPKMVNADIYSELHPLTDNKTINTLISIVVILCIALGGLVYRLINRKKRIKEAGIKYYETVRKEGISDVKTNSAMAIQVGQKIADDIKIRNFKESFEELYKIGKAIYKKRVMAAGTTGEEQGNSALDNILQEVDAAVGAEKIEKDKKSKVIIAGILAGTVTIVVVAAVIVVKMVVIPANTYNKAMALREAGNDEEAYDILNELGDFKDSREICNEYDYNDALDFLKAGNYGKAYLMLKNLSGYSDADTAAEGIIEEHPQVKILTAQAGDEVILGSYEQDNNTSNGAEPIKWTVLYNHGGIVYAVSKDILDAGQYNTANGDGSTLKQWLKEDFYKTAFADIEDGFVDKVGLLSVDDINENSEYVNTQPEWTDYSMSKDPIRAYSSGYMWWLDGDYFHGYLDVHVSMSVCTESGGYSNYVHAITDVCGVRPAITIDVSGVDIDYYLEDYDDINNSGVVTRTQADVDSSKNKIARYSGRSSGACSGGSVGCRSGFHPCHEMSNGYCNQCCADVD